MSFNPHKLPPVPDSTAVLAKMLMRPKRPEYRFAVLANQLEEILDGLDLRPFFPSKGKWGIHPFQVVCLLILQAMEGLTDRQAAEAVHLNVAWKYVLRLPVDHDGWAPSALAKARDRFAGTNAMTELLDELLRQADRKGYLNAVKQRTDSTHIIGYVRDLNRTELILETVRNALEALADAYPAFVLRIKRPEWLKRYYFDRPFNYRAAKTPQGQIELAETAGADGFYILQQIENCDDRLKGEIKSLPEIGTLEKILEQQFEPGGQGKGKPGHKLKDSKNLPPAGKRIVSPYETEARASIKGATSWLGYKVHTTETCVKGFPNLITEVTTTVGTDNDSLHLKGIAERLAARSLHPLKMLVDSGYVNVSILNTLKSTLGINVIARLSNGHSWQSKQGKGFDSSKFSINWRRKEATCPQKKTSISWKPRASGEINVSFDPADCSECPFLKDCTTSQARVLRIKDKEDFLFMRMMRQRQTTSVFLREYATRAGCEGTQAEMVGTGGRSMRVRGLENVDFHLKLVAVAINLGRLFHWDKTQQKSATRTAKYQRLCAS